MDQEKISEDFGILVGRLFTLGGSVLFLIGSFIAAVIAFNVYRRDLEQMNG
jgi:uncharacterized membrane protein YdjX (TVP38/TMEM64 family)